MTVGLRHRKFPFKDDHMHPSQFHIHLYRPDSPNPARLTVGYRFIPQPPLPGAEPLHSEASDRSAAPATTGEPPSPPEASSPLARVHLPAGHVVHINGIPLELARDAIGLTHPNNVSALFGPPDNSDWCASCNHPATTPDAGPTDSIAPQAFIGASRRPLRDWVRDRVIAAVLLEVPHGTPVSRIEDVVTDVAKERPLLDWLASGGLEALVRLVLSVLKLAA